MAASERKSGGCLERALGRGQAGVWATALATLVVLTLLAGLLWIVTVNTVSWFWPAKVWRVELDSGEVFIGEVVGAEEVTLERGHDSIHRTQLKVGNRDLGSSDFVWMDDDEVVSRDATPALVRVIRSEYGDAFGRLVEAHHADGSAIDVTDREEVGNLVDEARHLRRRLRKLASDRSSVRKPLTRAEERLDMAARSDRAATPAGRQEIAGLEHEVELLRSELAEQLAAIDNEVAAVEKSRARGFLALEIASGDRLEVGLPDVIDVVLANRMTTLSRLWRAVRDAALFLVTEPREANTEGGIMPALFGTALLVLIMSVLVVPLGVVTAVYMTEYAREGVLLRLANQAVNNLAGVPSIVFGMFGLAFLIYTVGGSVDRLFFSERLPVPTFGTGGILWASLTLALLTVPVVVVATRESLLTVPRGWREGALALGATQWQTLRRIILPASLPGILTGLILAVGRAAGEVAPLMLTGAVKLAPSLPLDGEAPFLHLERKFMHLGFHIYDVSMQSPNVEAAKPMAYATTLVLLLMVVVMNLAAMVVRNRLRRAYRGQAV